MEVDQVASATQQSTQQQEQQNMQNLMSQGAEGRLFLSELFGQPCVIKERFVKKYRHPVLDEKLSKSRILSEVKSMDRARKLGVPAPGVYLVDQTQRKIYMEWLGKGSMTVKQFLYDLNNFTHPLIDQLVDQIASAVATMHAGDLVHGDLTTSNLMIKSELGVGVSLEQAQIQTTQLEKLGSIGTLFVIDFGLAMTSNKLEDKAVDIYVLKRAFISTHPGSEELFERILVAYEAKLGPQKGKQILDRFRDVESRGRKRECFG